MIRRCASSVMVLLVLALAVLGTPAPKAEPAPEWWRLTDGSVQACNLLRYTDATPTEVMVWLEDRGKDRAGAAVLTSLWHGCAW